MNGTNPVNHRKLLAMILTCSTFIAGCAASPPRTSAVPVSSSVELAVAAENRRIPLRVGYPRSGRSLPVVLFSHGAYSSKDDYNPILDAWAAGGYVVISMTHRDSVTLGVKRGINDPRFFAWRLDDAREVLGRLDEVLAQVPGLAARTDTTRIAATGHSFGGLVSQTLGGATYFDPVTNQTASRADGRVRATIVFSGAGAFAPLLRPQDFKSLTGPLLVTVGTNDLKQAPDLTGYEWRKQPYDLAPNGTKYLLTLEGADHYLGGRVGRDDLPKDPNGDALVRAFNATALRFLDAYVKGDRQALAALQQRASQGGAAAATSRVAMEPLARLERN